MERFNLEKYLANPSRKVVTRDGRSVRVICTDMKSTTYPVVALVGNCSSGFEQVMTFSKNGEYAVNESSGCDLFNESSGCDLFFAAEKHVGWINIFRSKDVSVGTGIFNSKEEAEEIGKISINYVTTIKIEWED